MTDNLQAVMELLKSWRDNAAGGVYGSINSQSQADAFRRMRGELEAALAQQPTACDMGALCIGCEPRNADGSCPGEHVAAKTGDSDNDR